MTGTHAFDFNQRYIELRAVGFSPNASGVSLTVEAPEDGFVAPPGWYMLSVVNAWGLPSEARWVQVLP